MMKQTGDIKLASKSSKWSHGLLAPALLRFRTFGVALLISFFAILYWGFFASDRYVSEAHVIIQKTDLSSGQSMDFSSLLGNAGGLSADQLMLRDHLLSVDMLKSLDAKLDLRGHYSDKKYDIISRMWSRDEPLEKFHNYYLSRVSSELDGVAGILVVKAQAFTPEVAHEMTNMLVAEGERFMNRVAHSLADEQVDFLEKQVVQLKDRLMQTRMKVLDFQNRKELASPQGTAESLVGIVNQLEVNLTELQTMLSLKQAYLMPDSTDVVEIKMQIAATEKQLSREKARLTSPSGETLNKSIEEYQRLQMESEFALDVYKTALIALEKGRIDAIRTIKKISVVQTPTNPQYPLEPRRLYNMIVYILVTLMLAGIVQMLATIIRDHKE
jgi:capsular polysaccharide transport system permease protein